MDLETQNDNKAQAPQGPAAASGTEEAQRVLLHMPVDVRSMALVVLAALAVLAALHWAQALFIPLMVGFMFSYALTPVVDWLERWRVPRLVGAGMLILAILGSAGATIYSLADDANQLVESLPLAAQKMRGALHSRHSQAGTLDTVQKAAAQLEQAAEEAGAAAGAAAGASIGVQRVVIEKARFDIKNYLWTGTLGLLSLLGQVTVVTFLTYFLLVSGDTFRRKLVRITGPSFTKRKITVQALDEINGQIQRYLLVQLLAAVLAGVTTGLAFWALGLEHAAVWGVVAGVLNFIPYIGSIVVTGAAALVAFLQFGAVQPALLVGGASLLIHTVEGNLIVPWLTSKAGSMNPVAVFVSVLAWGWLWGVWGLLLGIPIMMVAKAICDRVEDLKPVGELLGS